MSADFWNVSIWVSVDSRIPVESKRFTGASAEEDAKRYAEHKRCQIRERGWQHIVTCDAGQVTGK